jgi:multidrug transporter EmrE-like cation transporter
MEMFLSVLAAGAYTVGGVFMRKAEGFAHTLPTVMVFTCFCVGATLQTLAMRRSEVSINYVLVLGLEAALAVLLGVALLGEGLSPRKLAGLALILAGVMSLRQPDRPEAAAVSLPAPDEIAPRMAAPQEAAGSRSTAGPRRPCQSTNHAPCP